MRRLETEARKEKESINGLKAAGDEEGARQHRKKLRAINEKYNKICDETGLTPQKERMRVYGGGKVAANAASRNTNKQLVFNPNADFSVKLDSLTDRANQGISKAAYKVAELGGKDNREHLSLIDIVSGEEMFFESGTAESVGSQDFWDFINANKDKNFAFIHNHNTDGYFSETDMRTLLTTPNIKIFGAIRIDGVKYFAEKTIDLGYTYYFDSLFKDELKDLNYQVRNGIITAAERTHRREEIIVDNLLKRYTKGLVEIDGRK